MAAVEVGVGYVSVVPSARGFADELQRQIGGATVTVGARVGEDSGQAASRSMLATLGAGLKAGLAGVAVAGAALFTAAFVQAVEQSKSNAKLAAQLGLDPKQQQRLGKIAGSVYSKGYGESIDQVNDSLRTLAQNGVIAVNAPRKDVESLTKSALNLAEAFDVEVGDAARAAGQLIRTGMVKDSREAFDLITRGFQEGADKGGDFIDTLNEYSTQFRKAGLDGASAVGLISQAIRAGARDSDIAADAIKEFSIRAVDGSTLSADGFKALGLNAVTMGQQFAKGGSAANTVLDTTLDKLRGVKDPVQQSQIAVALFGTQAEDLGAALFAMDPTTAVGALGKVGGAADDMGKALHGNAGASIETFKRQIMQGLSDFITREVLPALVSFGQFLNTYVLPAARTVGGILAAVLVPAVEGVAAAFLGGIQWLREYGAWLIPLGVAVGGLALTMGASAIATGAATLTFSVYRGVILAAAAVTRGYAIAQGILNAVMTANPIGLIITGIAALVALLVVAYNKSDTFRGIVQAAWAGIKAGWDLLWTNALKPGFDALVIALQAIGTAASWLWNTILSPVFSFIGTAAKVLFAIVAVAVIAPLVIAFQALGGIAGWLWDVAIKPAFDAIGAAAMLLWTVFVKPAFDNVMVIINGVGSVISWLWNSIVSPVFGWIGDKAKNLWANWIKPAFDSFKLGLQILGDKGRWLWDTVISPVFSWIGDKAGWLYNKAIRPAFDNVKKAVSLVGDAFEVAKDAIGKAWDKVSGIAKKPVNFIIEWVYTKGIKAVWDKVAGFVGLGKLPAAPKMLEAGGTVGDGWGPAAPMKVNRPTAIVGEGNPAHPEFVIPTDPKYRQRALALHAAAGTKLMADGGVLGGIGDWLSGAAQKVGGVVMDGIDFLSDPGAMWQKATAFIRDKVKEIGASSWAQTLARVPGKMLGGLKDKIVAAATSLFGGGDEGGGAWRRPVSASLGTRYGVRGNMWSSGYHTGTDFPAATGTAVRAAANGVVSSARSGGPYGNHIMISHGALSSMYAHLSSMAVRAGQRVLAGMRIGAVGATGNTTGPHLHFEARRRGATINPEPLLGYDSGGWLQRGFTPVLNKTGQPEAVLTPRQWTVAQAAIGRAVAAAAPSAASGGAGGGLQPGDRLALRIGAREFEGYVEELAEGVVEDTFVPVARAISGRRG
jgi:phage-related minor tail protein